MNPSVNRFSNLPQSSGDPQPESQESLIPPIPADEPATNDSETTAPPEVATATATRQQPIPPPSEPMQYRAIGLVQGKYTPSAEQFTRGTLLATDETAIDAVLLGRVMSLVKNHLDLEQEHLWVVYPRTRQQDGNLHVQIVGVWEPENLRQTPPTSESDESASEETESNEPDVKDGYFSVRGEVIFQAKDESEIIIKIKQAPRKDDDRPKFFKLKLNGTLSERAVGHFWDLQIERQGNSLMIQGSEDIGLLSPKKGGKKFKKPPRKGGGGPGRRPAPRSQGEQSRPIRKDAKPTTVTPPVRREPPPKPIKRQGPRSEGGTPGKTS